jgi:2-aminomuconate deaminase
MTCTDVLSSRAPEPVGPYPHAKRAGGFLFISGIGPRRRGSAAIPGVTLGVDGQVIDHDIEAQCRSCFENIRTIIEDAGARWEQIVDVTAFLTHLTRDFHAYNRVYAEWFAGPGKPNPTRTTVEVGALPTAIAVELKVILWLGSKG